VPSCSPALTLTNRLYVPGIGGTVWAIDGVDSDSPSAPVQLAFYGMANYAANPAAYAAAVFINTPITADDAGNIYFGYQVTDATPINLVSGLARVGAAGAGTYISAAAATNDPNLGKCEHNCAPALSNDGQTVYVAMHVGSWNRGYLVALSAATLAPIAAAPLSDPREPYYAAIMPDESTASPMVGPDGDVYFGVLENPFPTNHDRGFLLHYSADLSTLKTPGAFGWDNTPSVVPASMVPDYAGASPYLLMCKYNNYGGVGGDGINKIAVLDPHDSMIDPITGATVMKEIHTIAGQTPDGEFPGLPGAVREWCINSAAVDPATKSILANCEDGKLYRWDMTTHAFSQIITLTPGIGEAYTPTVVGVDGTVYAINNATLFAVGISPGDVNGDGVTNGDDVPAFVTLLLHPPGTTPERIAADLNADGHVDADDIPAFVALLMP
jgi:hypothetical protein